MLAPATLAALPSTRAIPDRDVFYVARPIRSIENSVVARTPSLLLAALPSISEIPFLDLSDGNENRVNCGNIMP